MLRFSLGLVASLLMGSIPTVADEPSPEPAPLPVPKVLTAKVQVEAKLPPNLLVTATGQVPTGGYTKPTLTPVVYVKPPADGIQDYQFTAVPPDGPAIQVISKVTATSTWTAFPAWVKGVRVHDANGGSVTTLIKD